MTSVAFVTGSHASTDERARLRCGRAMAVPMKLRKVYMSDHNLKSTLPLSIAVLGLAVVPAAQAAGTSVNVHAHSGDRSTLKVSNAREHDWKRQHVREEVLRPATRPGAMSYFPQSSGNWNFAKATGSLSYSGAIRIRRWQALGHADQAALHPHGQRQELGDGSDRQPHREAVCAHRAHPSQEAGHTRDALGLHGPSHQTGRTADRHQAEASRPGQQ